MAGVTTSVPTFENIKEDYEKVLEDWQEHIGSLQAAELEEDLNLLLVNPESEQKCLPCKIEPYVETSAPNSFGFYQGRFHIFIFFHLQRHNNIPETKTSIS